MAGNNHCQCNEYRGNDDFADIRCILYFLGSVCERCACAGSYTSFSFVPGSGYKEEDIETWEFYDQNGNKIEVFNENGETPQLKGLRSVSFVIPDEETGITEIHCYPIGPWSPDDSFASTPQEDEGILDRLLAFWQKIVDFIIELYAHIMTMFG